MRSSSNASQDSSDHLGGLSQNSTQAITEADVLITEALACRRAREPDLEAENQALHTLAQQLVDEPQSILKTLVRIAIALCRADTAGVSLLETAPTGESIFRWVAIAGDLESLEQSTTPGNFSPCSTTLQSQQPQLYARPERYFTYLHHPQFPIFEELLLPLWVNDQPLGTLWIVSHEQARQFDREDLRLMTSLAGFTTFALQSIHLRQTAEEALRREQAARAAQAQSQTRIEVMVANLPGMVYRYLPCPNSPHRFTFVNSGSQELLELEPETVLGDAGSFIKLIHPDDLASFQASVADAVENFLPWRWEGRIITPSGQFKWIQGSSRALPTSEGDVWDGLLIDITERKQAEIALCQSEEFNRQILESSDDCIEVLNLDGLLLYMNAGGQTLLGINDITPLLNRSWIEFWQGAEQQAAWEAINQAKAGKMGSFQGYCPTQTGIPKWWDNKVSPIKKADGQVERLLCISRDITGRKQVEDALRESEERYRVLTEVSPQVVWMGTSNGSITYCNQYWFDYTGLTMEQTGDGWALVKNGWASVIHPEDHERVLSTWKQAVASGTEYEVEIRFRRADDGAYRWHMARGLPVRNAGGQIVKWIGIASDIHERKQAEERLAHDALHDSLTGLANRSLFMNRLEHTIHRVRRTNEFSFAVLFLDLDRFKVINDSLGHTCGDQLLIAVARKLAMSLRLGDTVARLGGDEFVILLEDLSDSDEAIKVTQRIHQSLTHPFTIENQEIFISTSIGIAFASSHYTQAAQLLRDADTAMYQAKSCGKACSAVFDPSMHHQAVRQFALESDLRRAIERQELVVYYQPIISLATKELQGVEALVRWQHPQQGMISPSEFISIAEETGMIVNLDRQVLRLACTQLRSWQEQFPSLGPFTLSVNLSGKQFTQPNLVEYIEGVLTQTQMEGSCLKLEITESVLIENPQAATEMIAQLQRRKIQICLDDFGTGYSSLSYLHRFLPNILKIDRSFVSHLEASNSNATIIRTIVTMAHELGIGLIAEGVETKTQATFLQFLGCQFGQGYWFSPPLCAEEMTFRLKTNNFTG